MKNKSQKKPQSSRGTQKPKDISRKEDYSQENHPDHSTHLVRLNRVKGQIEGIERMIVDRRYCPDIIAQLKAASSALKAIEAEVFKTHLRDCVKQAFKMDDVFKSEEKIQEIIKLVY